MKHTILSIFDEESYKRSIEHRNSHKCGSYPFNHGTFLNHLVNALGAQAILEIGTGIGYSTLCLAMNNSSQIKTIDLSEEHLKIARDLWIQNEIENRIEMDIVNSETFLAQTKDLFDVVFVDAFAPNPDEVGKYKQLIGAKGVLVSSNHNWNKTTPEFIEKLNAYQTNFEILGDTLLCSDNPKTLKSCVELWMSTIDTTL